MKQRTSFVLFLVFLSVIIALRLSGAIDWLTLSYVQQQAKAFAQFTHDYYAQSVVVYIFFYILMVCLALPVGALLTVTGGYLFGTIPGAVYTNIGATIGATLLFLFVRYSIGKVLQKRFASQLIRFNRRLERNDTQFLLTARLVVLFPFFLVNLLAGMTQVPLRTFVWTTSIGILPSSLVFSFAGQKLHALESIQDIFTPDMIAAFLAVTLLVLIPLIYRRVRIQRNNGT